MFQSRAFISEGAPAKKVQKSFFWSSLSNMNMCLKVSLNAKLSAWVGK